MNETHQKPEPLKIIRKIMPFTSLALLLAIVYVGWTFFSRWQENRDLERKRAEATAENSRKVLDTLGGSELKILSLSLDRVLIRRGERLTLCYGVMNAKKVAVDPAPTVETWPSTNRCVDYNPTTDTKFTLTAEDANGRSQSVSVQVRVH